MDASNIKALMGRLNKNMTRAMEAAAGSCIQRTHYEITAEHCLLKLLDQEHSDITVIFTKLGIVPDQARAELDKSLAQLNAGNHAKPRFSVILLEALAQAYNFGSLERGEGAIRSAHLLVALLRDHNWLAVSRYAFLERLQEQQIVNQWDELTVGSNEVPRVHEGAPSPQASEALEAFTVNLVEQARKGEIDPIVERDQEIYQVIDILSRRRKNNPILVGEPGVGKSAIVEGLALLVAEGKAPPVIQGCEIRTLDLGLLKAGASMKGEFEERLKQVIDGVQKSKTPIVLFIDEAHTLIGAGGSAGSGDAANLLKPALARGKLRTIAATTWSEYKKYIEKDAALERRFQLVKVAEPDVARATRMLRGIKEKYSRHHGVEILDSAIAAAASLSDRYISGRQLPDKAIDLLDTACARVGMSLNTQPYDLTRLENLGYALEMEIEAREKETNLTGAPDENRDRLRLELAQCREQFQALKDRWEGEKLRVAEIVALENALAKAEGEAAASLREQYQQKTAAMQADKTSLVEYRVTPQTVGHIVSQWTGIPVGNMVRDELADLLKLDDLLKQLKPGS